jgi:autotransporter translocation and assembly factor TamB
MDGIYAPRIRRLGPDNATLSVHTRRGGAAAKAGHDLELHVTRWEATLDLDAGSAELTADGSSLRVEKGTGGMMELGDEDKDNIHKTIDDEVLEKRNITFRSTSFSGGEGRWQVEGELTLAGRTQPIAFDLTVAGDAISGSATLAQTRWGMKPFSALFGTLKVLDEVEVRLQSR